MPNTDYLFVYGTLRRNCSSGAHQRYLADAEFVGMASLEGSLYRVSYYPALVLNKTGNRVIGEVYKLRTSAQLATLDAYEECTYPALPAQEYQRQSILLTTDCGQQLTAWVYAYQHPVANLALITSGDFLKP